MLYEIGSSVVTKDLRQITVFCSCDKIDYLRRSAKANWILYGLLQTTRHMHKVASLLTQIFQDHHAERKLKLLTLMCFNYCKPSTVSLLPDV